MTLNQHELEAMAGQARELGAPFRYDAAIFPCLPNGSTDPLDLRVSPEDVVAHDMADPVRRQQWIDKIEATRDQPEDDRLYSCGAGATSFYSDPFGNLSPCLMTTHYRYEQGRRSFLDVWEGDLREIRTKRKTKRSSCLTGPLRGACTHCPAFNFLETGDEEQESAYIRETTALRYREALKWNIES
jgi:radical SAM protein with 4Fe4S-binding SPASM domain